MKPYAPKSIVIARHNGIGDIIMTFPFIKTYVAQGHDVTLEVAANNLDWIPWFFPDLKLLQTPCAHELDYRKTLPGYDCLLNFNRLEMQDFAILTNYQHLMTVLAVAAGLPKPEQLSPCVKQYTGKRSGILLFSNASHPSRWLSTATTDMIKHFTYAVDAPIYPTRLALIEAIYKAELVIGPDSGPIHIAEAVGTPWVCLHTTFTKDLRHLYYQYGRCVQSLNPPCYSHICTTCHVDNRFHETDVLMAIRLCSPSRM